MTYIYALVDPRDRRVRYVGKSIDPQKRLQTHLRTYEKNRNDLFKGWFRQLVAAGIKPQLRILLAGPKGSSADDFERHWIWAFRWAGEKLTNLHEGGTGGPTTRDRKFGPRPQTGYAKRAGLIARALGLPEQGPEPKVRLPKEHARGKRQPSTERVCRQCKQSFRTYDGVYCSRQCYWHSLEGKAPWNKGKTAPGISEAKRKWWSLRTPKERQMISEKRIATMKEGSQDPHRVFVRRQRNRVDNSAPPLDDGRAQTLNIGEP